MKLIDMTTAAYLAELGSDAPAPGGGSASALCGAQGAGLAAMVAALTLGKKKYEADQALCEGARTECARLQAALTAQIDADTEAFNAVSAAFKLPKESDADKTARSVAIQKATLLATEVPFGTMKLAVEALTEAQKLVGHSNTNAASDLGVAALNLTACVKGAWLNVLINLGGLKDEAACAAFRADGTAMVREAELLGNSIYTAIELLVV